MAKDFDLTISRAELNRLAPELLDCLREFVMYGGCRQNNTAERRMLSEHFAELAHAAIKRFPHLKLNHCNAKTIITEGGELPFNGSHAPDCPYVTSPAGECLCWRSDPAQNPDLDPQTQNLFETDGEL